MGYSAVMNTQVVDNSSLGTGSTRPPRPPGVPFPFKLVAIQPALRLVYTTPKCYARYWYGFLVVGLRDLGITPSSRALGIEAAKGRNYGNLAPEVLSTRRNKEVQEPTGLLMRVLGTGCRKGHLENVKSIRPASTNGRFDGLLILPPHIRDETYVDTGKRS